MSTCASVFEHQPMDGPKIEYTCQLEPAHLDHGAPAHLSYIDGGGVLTWPRRIVTPGAGAEAYAANPKEKTGFFGR